MNIIDAILKVDGLPGLDHFDYSKIGSRYYKESNLIFILSNYALNKEKNACKGDFEDIRLQRILSLFLLESKELVDEVHRDPIDYRKTLEEIADCAALLSGMIANIMHEINKQKKES